MDLLTFISNLNPDIININQKGNWVYLTPEELKPYSIDENSKQETSFEFGTIEMYKLLKDNQVAGYVRVILHKTGEKVISIYIFI